MNSQLLEADRVRLLFGLLLLLLSLLLCGCTDELLAHITEYLGLAVFLQFAISTASFQQ